MRRFAETLHERNSQLYYFGWFCLFSALVCLLLSFTTDIQVLGINAWIKPFKFFLSSAIFCWTIAWYMNYLNEPKKVSFYSWMVIAVLSFETLYIAVQAGLGELSHFNNSSAFHSFMFGLMGLAITFMTLWTGYIGWLFYKKQFPDLPLSYVWGIRIGITIFVIFALQGGIMGQNMAHTIGASDGGDGLPILNWSTDHGDLRIAHFFGMHALQIIPLAAFYVFRNTWYTIIFGLAYFGLTGFLLFQALMGLPLIG